MSVTKSIPTDHFRGLDVHRGDTLRVLEVHEEKILVELQPAHPAPPRAAGQASEWLRTARGSVRLAPTKSADDARRAYYAEKYGLACGNGMGNKRWYKVVKESHDAGDPVYDALAGIPTEPSTPAPDPIETVAQGGDNGLQVLVQYVPGGGDHATTKDVQWEVTGVDPAGTFPHTAPLDASGNALEPFVVGKTVKIRTAVSNSSETRTTAPRTITVATPIV